MSMVDYTNRAMRTNADITETASKVSPDLIHAALGIADETAEVIEAFDLFTKNVITAQDVVREVGDAIWFVALFFRAAPGMEPLEEYYQYLESDTIPGWTPGVFSASAGAIIGLVKKHYAYGQRLELGRVEWAAIHYLYLLRSLLERMLGSTMEEAQQLNIDKLAARYPEGFDAYRAVYRNEEGE